MTSQRRRRLAAALDFLLADDPDGAREVLAAGYPELLDDAGPVVDASNYQAALFLAAIEYQAGRIDETRHLLEAAETAVELVPRQSPSEAAVFSLRVAALRGQNAVAIGILRNLIDSGWTRYAHFYFDYDPALEPVRDDPEFQVVRTLWQAKLAEYRESLAKKWADAGFD
jgi:hypothetical protein